ncbi:hypothetical protein QFZ75_003654 [Streptomyces sp. V3I8]|uniref:hypothetical protein n=1 Tax=Streptomyces sp. V3I8 TaxID=3042279 RepID=UPI002781A61A|nr:hypothetical protein [Streptomyces sp. V3I8]MDQ1037238.1 hypothetical protein [Streptomyces sp. V3I8]
MTKIEPNPHSPYADAAPDARHIFPTPVFFSPAAPGVLALTACEGMAVVPETLVETGPDAGLPEGLCAACVTVMQGGAPPERTSSACGECGSATYHDTLCALCRQEKHEAWWPTRGEAPAAEGPAAPCGKCKQPFDPADRRFAGRARYGESPYCRGCVGRCHDSEIADHRCVICA